METSYPPKLISVRDAQNCLGVGRTTVFKCIADGRLCAIKIGTRTLIEIESVQSLIENSVHNR